MLGIILAAALVAGCGSAGTQGESPNAAGTESAEAGQADAAGTENAEAGQADAAERKARRRLHRKERHIRFPSETEKPTI